MTLSLQVIQFMTLLGAGVRRHPPVAARPLCWVKRTWLRDQQQGPLRTQAKQAGPNACVVTKPAAHGSNFGPF